MNSSQQITTKEEEGYLRAMQYANLTHLPFALKTAVDLDLLEIIAKSGPGSKVSAAEIVSKLPAKNPNAPDIIDRILRFLTTHSVLDCDLVTDRDGNTVRFYGVSSTGKYFLRNEDGISILQQLNSTTNTHSLECWKFMKETALEGELSPYERFRGASFFEVVAKDRNLANAFNQSLSNHTAIIMERVLQNYNGFAGLTQLIDVGGGLGTNLKLIVSKYPQIKGINFDLPFVVEDAPNIPGVEHVGGDMFDKIPKGKVIFMKNVLHDWGEKECLKLLRNCYEAIPESGKVIILESIMPELPTTDVVTTTTTYFDVGMLLLCPGGKERTLKEFQTLATRVGFSALKPVCRAYNYWVMELFKNLYNSTQ
ncbi:caffeate O-methyltransferase 1, O-methyltransferase 1, O-methyltransferase 3 [Hibiscus trionum]|uniref:Caffeate O-methyltransferase 1, O-methyltransferase 1, O-methyltransferase 3 n=1 Tax=Hibiscus trionum TaxID=183268 RepID=A0A9W7GYV9_HIBTR|nr:caffeate O-methyltransferase 1, O-methyltransferase 1, O-methyltransferase 3 [Hibiscus trionum]